MKLGLVLARAAVASSLIKGEARYNNYPLSTTKCGFEDNSIKNYAAVGPANFNSSLACGQCAVVKNLDTQQMVQVIIVDQCLGCSPTDIIMDKASFGMIADTNKGFINVDWQMNACSVKGQIEYTWVLPPGTNLIALQVLNLAVPALGVEAEIDGQYLSFRRLGYNLFGGLLVNAPKISLRITSVFHEMLMEKDVMVGLGVKTTGLAQFSVFKASPSQVVNGQFFPDMGELVLARIPQDSALPNPSITYRDAPSANNSTSRRNSRHRHYLP